MHDAARRTGTAETLGNQACTPNGTRSHPIPGNPDLLPLQVLTQALNFALVLSTALMMWKGLAVACNTDSPVVVVLT